MSRGICFTNDVLTDFFVPEDVIGALYYCRGCQTYIENNNVEDHQFNPAEAMVDVLLTMRVIKLDQNFYGR